MVVFTYWLADVVPMVVCALSSNVKSSVSLTGLDRLRRRLVGIVGSLSLENTTINGSLASSLELSSTGLSARNMFPQLNHDL